MILFVLIISVRFVDRVGSVEGKSRGFLHAAWLLGSADRALPVVGRGRAGAGCRPAARRLPQGTCSPVHTSLRVRGELSPGIPGTTDLGGCAPAGLASVQQIAWRQPNPALSPD